jgi:hypothetical protein
MALVRLLELISSMQLDSVDIEAPFDELCKIDMCKEDPVTVNSHRYIISCLKYGVSYAYFYF